MIAAWLLEEAEPGDEDRRASSGPRSAGHARVAEYRSFR